MGLIINPYRYAAPAGPTLPTPWLRYRADDVALADGAAIGHANIVDASGNGRVPTASSSPAAVLRHAFTPDGHHVFEFIGAGGRHYSLPSMSAFTEAEAWFVYKATANNINAGAPHNWDAGNSTAAHWPFTSGANLYDHFFSTGRYNTLTPAVNLASWHIIRLRHKGSSPGGYIFVQNDQLVHMANGTFDSPNNTPLFGESGAGTASFHVADLIVYNAWQTGVNLKATIDYLLSVYSSISFSNVWTNKVGVSESAGVVTKTLAGDAWATAGAFSVLGRVGDCVASYTVAETNKRRLFGLTYKDATLSFGSTEYTFVFSETGFYDIWESGSGLGLTSPYATSDVFEIIRTGTTITYKKNGALVHTSGSAVTTAELFVDVAIYSNGGTMGPISF